MGAFHTRFLGDETFQQKVMFMRDAEVQAYEREMMVSAFKEAEWMKERKRLRGEVKRLKKKMEDQEAEKLKEVENTMEKWKQLYFDIKNELDDLIQRTNQGEGLCLKAGEEEMVGKLQKEVMAKEQIIELQQSKIESMKQEESRREVESTYFGRV